VESSGSRRSGRLTAGGVLSIVGGAFEVVGGGTGLAVVVKLFIWSGEHALGFSPLLGTAAFGVALGVVAIVGGVSALRRRSFGLSLAGAICALPSGSVGTMAISLVAPAGGSYALTSVIVGILAIVFISLSKREFEVQKQMGEVVEKGVSE
jgi:hypothetical protein